MKVLSSAVILPYELFFPSQHFVSVQQHRLVIFLFTFSEEESRLRIRELQQKIHSVKQEKAEELARRAEVIAYQKDQLQEAKAKAQLEVTYEKKKCENHLEQVRERCFIAEQEMRREQEVKSRKVHPRSRSADCSYFSDAREPFRRRDEM